MRGLTEEELKLAPDWATHYYAYADGDILFECDTKCTLYIKGSGFMLKTEKCKGVCLESVPLNNKPFDINKHEFSDSDLSATIENGELSIGIELDSYIAYSKLNKSDAIAIARALDVTGDDLK